MHWWFGMDLSSAPFSHHGANQALLTIPYLVLIGMAIFLQYYQMKQMNSRNPQAAAANPQMQQMQKFFPIIFGVIYLRVPAGATIYMVVSSAMRIGTQEYMFRSGMVTPVGAAPAEKATEREIGGASGAPKAAGPQKAIGTGTGRPARRRPRGSRRRRGRRRRKTDRRRMGKRRPMGSRPAPFGGRRTGKPRMARAHQLAKLAAPTARNHHRTRKSSSHRCPKSTHARDPRGQERLDRAWSG